MSWKPKDTKETLEFKDGSAEGLTIHFTKKMSIRELNKIQKLNAQDNTSETMKLLCQIISSKIIAWNYDGVKPTADNLIDMPYDEVSEITSQMMEAIVGKTDENLAVPSPNGLNLGEASGVTVQP